MNATNDELDAFRSVRTRYVVLLFICCLRMRSTICALAQAKLCHWKHFVINPTRSVCTVKLK